VEDTLSNSVHVAPFWSLSICPYCVARVDVTSISSWIEHFLGHHRRLFSSFFTCPTCIGIRVYNVTSYIGHWEEAHAPSLALIVVLDESNVSARYGCGLALFTIMKIVDLMKLAPQEPNLGEADRMDSVYGGYCPATDDGKRLAVLIKRNQMAALPGDWRTEKEKQEEELAQRKRLAASQAGARAAKQRPATRGAEEWRDPTPTMRSAASSRAGSPAPSQSWADVAAADRPDAGPYSVRSEVFASPAATGDQWEPTPGEIENLLRLDSEAGDDSKMDDNEEEEM
jgi:hypothetical protein